MDHPLAPQRMEVDMNAPLDPEALACIQEPYRFRVVLDFTSDEQGKRVSMEFVPVEPAKISVNLADIAILMDSIRYYSVEMVKGEANKKIFKAQLEAYLKKHLLKDIPEGAKKG